MLLFFYFYFDNIGLTIWFSMWFVQFIHTHSTNTCNDSPTHTHTCKKIIQDRIMYCVLSQAYDISIFIEWRKKSRVWVREHMFYAPDGNAHTYTHTFNKLVYAPRAFTLLNKEKYWHVFDMFLCIAYLCLCKVRLQNKHTHTIKQNNRNTYPP